MMIKQPAFMPTIAIVDPILTITSPPAITAATGIDALSHAIESYLSRLAHPYSNVLALSAMELIVNNIIRVYEHGDDVDARKRCHWVRCRQGCHFLMLLLPLYMECPVRLGHFSTYRMASPMRCFYQLY